MDLLNKNPFETFKANDLDDGQINSQWVDLHEKSFYDVFSPTNSIAMYILGGKGSGKTHLMRYFSHKSQMLRHNGNEVEGIQSDGYFGVYFQASGLNGDRFEELECSDEKKKSAFIYSFELWMSGLFLDSILNLAKLDTALINDESLFFNEALNLFDTAMDLSELEENLLGLKMLIDRLSKEMDLAINNASVLGNLNFKVLTGRGSLIFGLPQLVNRHSESLKKVNFLYLIDELENISPFQQKYFNTLVREKKFPVTFRVGARLHGIYTYKVLGANEVNRSGHEFETIWLDDIFSVDKDNYEKFATRLIINRLLASGILTASKVDCFKKSFDSPEESKKLLSNYFENFNIDDNLKSFNPAYLKSKSLSVTMGKFKARVENPKNIDDAGEVVRLLGYPQDLIAEQAGIHLFCQQWAKENNQNIVEIAKDVQVELMAFSNRIKDNKISKKILHYKNNYIANILRSQHGNNFFQYVGFENLLEISKGFPRHILTLLRHIYKQEVFLGNSPFKEESKISIRAQHFALKESAEWFHNDCVTEGELGSEVSIALDKICEVLRVDTYADKPVESSPSNFSVKLKDLSDHSIEVLKWAEKIRVIISATPRQDRNSQKVNQKYKINGLLCPRWGLPVQRRGELSLPSEVADSFFNISKNNVFSEFVTTFTKDRMAPFPVNPKDNNNSPQNEMDV